MHSISGPPPIIPDPIPSPPSIETASPSTGSLPPSSPDAPVRQVVHIPEPRGPIYRIFHHIRQNHLYKKQARNCLAELKTVLDPNTHTGKIAAKEGVVGLLKYLNTDQSYEVVGTKATWGGLVAPDSFLAGKVGHHATIVIPGGRQIERGAKTDLETAAITETEKRTATGRTIEKLWQTHLTLQQESSGLGFFNREAMGLFHYRPFESDCWTFVDRVLSDNGEPVTTLRKASENEPELRVLVDTVYLIAKTVLISSFVTLRSPPVA